MKIPTQTEAKAFKDSLPDVFDPRNLAPAYKGLTVEAVRKELTPLKTALVVLCPNVIRDMNWGSLVRNANGFGVREVVFTGAKKYDRRGAVGAQNYTEIHYYPRWQEAFAYYIEQGYVPVAVENNVEFPTKSLFEFTFPAKTLLIFGEEGVNIPDEILAACKYYLEIPMRGSVRSFNLSTASGIVMAFYNYQHAKS